MDSEFATYDPSLPITVEGIEAHLRANVDREAIMTILDRAIKIVFRRGERASHVASVRFDDIGVTIEMSDGSRLRWLREPQPATIIGGPGTIDIARPL